MAKTRILARQRETAINVMIGTKLVHGWAAGELKFLQVDLDSPEGQRLLEKECRKLATKLVDNRA